jgi:hypothetical protein
MCLCRAQAGSIFPLPEAPMYLLDVRQYRPVPESSVGEYVYGLIYQTSRLLMIHTCSHQTGSWTRSHPVYSSAAFYETLFWQYFVSFGRSVFTLCCHRVTQLATPASMLLKFVGGGLVEVIPIVTNVTSSFLKSYPLFEKMRHADNRGYHPIILLFRIRRGYHPIILLFRIQRGYHPIILLFRIRSV